jgi:AraC family transcriptional regulator, ethanolamine operon transcriptional activator
MSRMGKLRAGAAADRTESALPGQPPRAPSLAQGLARGEVRQGGTDAMRPIGGGAVAAGFSTQEPEEFGSRLEGGQFAYMPLAGHRFTAALRQLRVGEMMVQRVRVGACVNRGAIQPGINVLILPLAYDGPPPSVNGMALAAQDAVLLPGGKELVASGSGMRDWASIVLPPDLLADMAELAPPRGAGAVSVLRLNTEPALRLAAALRAGLPITGGATDEPGLPGAADRLAASLREMVAEVLAPGIGVASPGRATQEALRVLRASEEFLHANLTRPIHRDELCAALGVSRRKLHDAFVATVGASPAAYLKLRRLVLARRALREGGGGPMLVKSVALAHGFWHLGHFAQDYRDMFGELPSRTVAEARGG